MGTVDLHGVRGIVGPQRLNSRIRCTSERPVVGTEYVHREPPLGISRVTLRQGNSDAKTIPCGAVDLPLAWIDYPGLAVFLKNDRLAAGNAGKQQEHKRTRQNYLLSCPNGT